MLLTETKPRNSSGELRLALVSIMAALAEDPELCSRRLDDAAAVASIAPADLLNGDPARRTAVRLGAARVLNSACAACGACPRGRAADGEPFMPQPPER